MSDEEKKPAGGKPAQGGVQGAASDGPAVAPKKPDAPKPDPAAAAAALAAFESSLTPGDLAQAADQKQQKQQNQQQQQQEPPPKPAGPPPPVVCFDHVTKTYNPGKPHAFTAIKDVHFTVKDLPGKGELVCLLGPSGCGKSTILRLIAGLEPQHPPTEGRVDVFGKPVEQPGADRGMVFQSYTSFDNRTVLRNVAFGLECQGVSRKEREELARDWIDRVGLSVDHDAHKYPHQLSGGMQQRVAIARTLILRPKIILMDEPFGALDPVTRIQMQDLLVNLWRDQECTVFFVTHSIAEAVYLGDRCYLLSGSPGTILRELELPPPDRPAMEMQKDLRFQEMVYELSDMVHRMEQEQEQARQKAKA